MLHLAPSKSNPVLNLQGLIRQRNFLNCVTPTLLPQTGCIDSRRPVSQTTCRVESDLVSLKAPSDSPNTLRATWFYLCHHISLSGGKVPLMTQRLLALCFGLPVNAGHADGISHSLRDQFTITIIVFCRQAAMKPIWAASLSGEMVSQNGLQRPSTGCVPKDAMVFLLTVHLSSTFRL